MMDNKIVKADIRHIVAIALNTLVIGHEGDLPWHIPEDLKRFRRITMGNAIVMGRKTHESIGKVLDGRLNVVVSTTMDEQDGLIVARNIPSALIACAREGYETIYIIGGESLYAETLPYTQVIDATVVKTRLHVGSGDTFYPPYNEDEFDTETIEDTDEYSFVRMTRK